VYDTILSGDLTRDDAPSFANRSDNSYHVATYDDPSATGQPFRVPSRSPAASA